MSETLFIGLVSAGVTLLGIIVSLITVLVSARTTRDEVTKKLDTNQQVMNNEIGHIKEDMSQMKADIQAHNNYAKLFNENIPVIKEKILVANHRLKDLEDDVKFYHRGHNT